MEIRHLIYFRTVAEELHFTKAAAKLFISQPPLSRQIKELEEELGVQLFTRSNKQVVLTDAGKYFKKQVDAIFLQLEESKHVVSQIHLGTSGELKIGYISSVYQSHLAEVLKSMRKEFPHVKTSLYEVPTISQIKELEQGKLDAGILRAPVLSEKLVVKTLFFDPFLVVIPYSDQTFTTRMGILSPCRTELMVSPWIKSCRPACRWAPMTSISASLSSTIRMISRIRFLNPSMPRA